MLIGQQGRQCGGTRSQLLGFAVAQFVNEHRIGATELVERAGGKPARLPDAEVAARWGDDRQAWDLSCFANEVDHRESLLFAVKIQAVDENDRTAARGQVRQKIVRAAVEVEDSPHGQPSLGYRAAGAQDDDLRLRPRLHSEVL